MVYAGIHKRSDTWKSRNYLGSGYYLKHALKAYGRKNFSIEVLWECDTKKEALELEGLLVDKEWLKSPLVYNILCGGGGKKEDFKQSTKDKISQSLKNYFSDPEHRKQCGDNIKLAYQKNPFWDEYYKSERGDKTRCKISKKRKAYLKVYPFQKGEKHFNYGTKRTPETRLKMSLARKRYFQENPPKKGEEHFCFGKKLSEEEKEKISKRRKLYLQDPENILKLSNTMKNFYSDPENRKKTSLATKLGIQRKKLESIKINNDIQIKTIGDDE